VGARRAPVAHHRKNLRRKLGLPAHGARLASALAVLPAVMPPDKSDA
jgi:hypothetical protein